MDMQLNIKENVPIDFLTLQKMVLLFNAVEDGWEIKKHKDRYIFNKNFSRNRDY